MTKYDERFKLEIVQEYLSGSAGHKRVAQLRDVPRTRLLTWVKLYQAHGTDGLKKKFSHYSAEFKLTVIERMPADALSFGQVAALFNIRNASCVGRWERCYDEGGLEALAARKRGRSKKMPELPDKKTESLPDAAGRTHEELVAEVNQLRMEVAYLKKLRALVQAQQPPQTTTRKKRK
jgi:transposase